MAMQLRDKLILSLAVLLLVGTLTLCLPGCNVFDDSEQEQAMVQNVGDEAVALLQASANRVTELENKPNKTPQELGELAKARATIEDLQAKLDTMMDDTGAFTDDSILNGIFSLLPPPIGIPASIFGGGLLTWIKGRKGRKSFQALVEAMNTAKIRHPELATALDTAGGTLKSLMGEKATKVVDLARKEGKFPIV